MSCIPHKSHYKNKNRKKTSYHCKGNKASQIKNHLTQLRDVHKGSTIIITLNKDKILLNCIENETFAFKINSLLSVTPFSNDNHFEQQAHSKEITETKSIFQSTHIIYAHKVGTDCKTTESVTVMMTRLQAEPFSWTFWIRNQICLYASPELKRV